MAWQHHFLVLPSRCIQVECRKVQDEAGEAVRATLNGFYPKSNSWLIHALQTQPIFRPQDTRDDNQLPSSFSTAPETRQIRANCCLTLTNLPKQCLEFDQSEAPGSNHVYGINCLIRRCMEGHLLVYVLIAAWKLAVMLGNDFSVRWDTERLREVGTVHMVAEEKQHWPDDGLAKLNIFNSFLSFFFLLTTMLFVTIEWLWVGRQTVLFICSPCTAHSNYHQFPFKPFRVSLQ